MATIKLTDAGILLYVEAFFADRPLLIDTLLNSARYVGLEARSQGVSVGRMQPRLTASYGDEGATYRWS